MISTENIDLDFDKNLDFNEKDNIEIKKRFIIFHAGIKLEYLKRFVV